MTTKNKNRLKTVLLCASVTMIIMTVTLFFGINYLLERSCVGVFREYEPQYSYKYGCSVKVDNERITMEPVTNK